MTAADEQRAELVDLLETIFIKNDDGQAVALLEGEGELDGGFAYYTRVESTIRLLFGERWEELLRLMKKDNEIERERERERDKSKDDDDVEDDDEEGGFEVGYRKVVRISAEEMRKRRAMDRVMRMFGDTFRKLGLLRDSLIFRPVELDKGHLQNELKSLGWGKAEKMLVLLTDRLEAITRANENELDFDKGLVKELKQSVEDLNVFMKVTEAMQQGLRRGKLECSSKFFGRGAGGGKQGEDHALSLNLLFESGIFPSDYPDLNLPNVTWEMIQKGRGSSQGDLIKDNPNYYLELGQRYPDQMHLLTHLQWIIGTENDIPFYAQFFRHKDHVNYIGEDDTVGAVAISIEVAAGDRNYVRAIVRTTKKDDRHLIAAALKPKEQLKALARGYPWVNHVKFTRLRDNNDLNDTLVTFEKSNIVKSYKFGVLYRAEGQEEENDMFCNQHGSEAFEEFLDFLGDRIKLKGWDKYRGGLDTKNDTTGTHTVYRQLLSQKIEVVYHVSTLLPFFPSDPQQLERKRHLGNDVVMLIFNESSTPFDPAVIRSEFNHIFFVISKLPSPQGSSTRYRLQCAAKKGVEPFPPLLSKDKVFTKGPEFLDWLMAKLINSERVAMTTAPAFQLKMERTRRALLHQIVSDFGDKRKEK